ncbi:hypothetical protein RCL1_004284 [Eukaryota sp. TZLM3-RCL]
MDLDHPSPIVVKAAHCQYYLTIVSNVLSLLWYGSFAVVGLIHYFINTFDCDRPLAFYSLVFGVSGTICQVCSSLIPLLRGVTKDKARDRVLKLIGGVLGIFVFVWFIVFNIHTFGAVVCDPFLRNFCYWGIISFYVLIVSIITISCCFMCMAFKGMTSTIGN